jgi:tripartite-type tricarboxylate transporter receptor subunit TctC
MLNTPQELKVRPGSGLLNVTLITAVVSLLPALAAPAFAQNYPAKPLRLIVPWAAGSGTDRMSRMIAQNLGDTRGQQVVVDNRGGAGATIGTDAAAKSAPDGYTVYIGGSVSMAISPVIYPKVGYDPVRDFAPIALITRFYNALSVHPSMPAKSVRELIALAKARPGALVVPSAGGGSTSHLAAELFKSMSGTEMLHVPYKGGGQMVIAVISGEGQLMFSPVSTAVPHAKTGKLRMLGVSSAARLTALPEVPAIAETLKGYEFGGWQGLLAPAGTPPELVNRLHAAVLKVVATPEFKDYAAGEGSDIIGSTPDWFAQFLRNEVTKHATLVKAANVRPD